MNDDNNQIPEHSIQAALQSTDDANMNPAPQNDDQGTDWGHPGTPVNDQPTVVASVDQPAPEAPVSEVPEPVIPQPHLATGSLDDIKQKAIGDLSPLLQHLDQTPEDKFRTTMMMIQATDDKSLVSAAYEAANAIPDEKAKAQALLDVINEVNYFTQHPQHEQ